MNNKTSYNILKPKFVKYNYHFYHVILCENDEDAKDQTLFTRYDVYKEPAGLYIASVKLQHDCISCIYKNNKKIFFYYFSEFPANDTGILDLLEITAKILKLYEI